MARVDTLVGGDAGVGSSEVLAPVRELTAGSVHFVQKVHNAIAVSGRCSCGSLAVREWSFESVYSL